MVYFSREKSTHWLNFVGLLFSQENLVYFFREGSSHWLNFVGLLFSGLLTRVLTDCKSLVNLLVYSGLLGFRVYFLD